VSSGQKRMNSELKTDILDVEEKICPMQEQLRHDIQHEISSVKEDQKSEM
jgi:hypothetical protein